MVQMEYIKARNKELNKQIRNTVVRTLEIPQIPVSKGLKWYESTQTQLP